MGNLTRAAYANQRMTLYPEIGKISVKRRNTMVALRGAIRVACFIIHVFYLSCLAVLLLIPYFTPAAIRWRTRCREEGRAFSVAVRSGARGFDNS